MSERDRERDPADADTGTFLGADLAPAWPGAEPPADFADRVVARRRASRLRSRSRGARVAAGVTGALTLALVAWAGWRWHGSAAGTLAPGERTSHAVGRRATVVAEPGADLAYAVAWSGAARVEQRRGSVFYRIERGGSFVVATPTAEIVVKGTCFHLEVVPMNIKQQLLGAAVGAASAAAVTVTVYEGRVEVRSASGAMEAGPGDKISVAAHAPPRLIDAEATAAPAASQTLRERAQQAEIARLHTRLAELEGQPVRKAVVEERVAIHGGKLEDKLERERATKFLDLSREDWAEMAARCEVRMQLPPLGLGDDPGFLDAREAAELGYGAEDRRQYNELLRSASDRHRGALAAIYEEITGEKADRLTSLSLDAEIRAKSPPAELAAARRRYAEEQAGIAPRADAARLGPADRFVRVQAGAWADFEGKLAALVGADKARATRNRAAVVRLRAVGCQ